MTTETATSQQTGKTLRAQRARAKAERDSADAELRALAAQEAAHLAEAEAEGARQQAEQQQALARLAEQRAELDKVDAFLAQQRQREYADIRAAVDRWHEMQRQLKELAT